MLLLSSKKNNIKGTLMYSSSKGIGLGTVVIVVLVIGFITFLTKL